MVASWWMRAVAVAATMLAMASAAQAIQIVVPDPPEPTVAELLSAAGLKADDPDALIKRLYELRQENQYLVDVWIAEAHVNEYHGAQGEVARAMQAAPVTKEVPWALPPAGMIDRLVADLKARRLSDHARLMDALLRQLGKVGRAKDLAALYGWPNGRTSYGQWKVHAAAEEIIARSSVEELTPKGTFAVPGDVAAVILGDVEPEKAAPIAALLLKVQEESQKQVPLGTTACDTRVRLAWIVASADPDKALATLGPMLESHDPANRLAAGLAIASLSDSRIPFRLTAPPEETREARTKWLAALKPQKPRDFVYPDPFETPLIKGYTYYTRMDMMWVDPTGKTVREEKDVWPLIQDRLPDGTLLCREYCSPHGLTLTGPEGEVFSRLIDDRSGHYWSGGFHADIPRGGILAPCDDGRGAIEFGFNGSILWQAMIGTNPSTVRGVAPAGRGRVLLVTGDAARIVDRRGDTVWEVKPPAGVRDACMIDADTVLVVAPTCIEIHNRQKGLVKKFEGFESAGWIRYHPDRPWIVEEGRGPDGLVIFDPATGKKVGLGNEWKKNEHGSTSRWAKSGPWPAE